MADAQETPNADGQQGQDTGADGATPPAPQDPAAKTAADNGPEGADKKDGAEGDGEGDKGVPEKYELTLPKDTRLDAKAMERTAAYARELGLSNEQAQALLDRDHQLVSDHHKAVEAEFEQKVNGWVEQIKTDKEIGGEMYSQSAENAKRVLDRFGSAELRQALNETGLGNHPELVRIFARIGLAMANDDLPTGDKGGGDKQSKRLAAMYPSMQQ